MLRTCLALSLVLSTLGCGDEDTSEITGNGNGNGNGTNEAAIARGRYLVDHVFACPDCHTPRDAMGAFISAQNLAGTECFVELPSGSCLHTPNLTNHETGLLNRTDAEIEQMIRDGIRPTATGDVALSPVMPYYVYSHMNDEDLSAVIAYLRSVTGVDHAVPRSGPEFEVAAPANPIDDAAVPMPMAGYPELERAQRGRYLAIPACLECHTQHIMDPNVIDYTAMFAGGEPFPVPLPSPPVSSNLTSDPDTGLGTWTVEDIVRVLKEGIDKDGEGICPPMPVGPMGPFGGLTDDDALDIAHYIKSLPPMVNAIDDMCSFPPM